MTKPPIVHPARRIAPSIVLLALLAVGCGIRVDELATQLNDPRPRPRVDAAIRLRAYRHDDATRRRIVRELTTAYRGATHPEVKIAVLRSLCACRAFGSSVVEMLLEEVEGESDASVRSEIVSVLARSTEPRVGPVLAKLCRHDPEPVVRATAAAGLGRIDPERFGRVLMAAAADDSPRVRRAARRSLDGAGIAAQPTSPSPVSESSSR